MTARSFLHPASPPNYDALVNAALAMPYGIAQYNALLALRGGHSAYSRTVKKSRVHTVYVGDTMKRLADRMKEYSNFAWYCALNLTPNYVQAVKEYNSGLNPTQPWFSGLFANLNNYYKQGQAARGRLTPEAGQAALKQWTIDMQPGGFEKAMDALQQYVTIALYSYAGGVLASEVGAAVGREAAKQQNAPDMSQVAAAPTSSATAPSAPPQPQVPGVVPPVKPGVSSPGKKKVPFRYSCLRDCCYLSLLERIYKWMPLSTTQNAAVQA